jgi:DNA polymerase-3 subunit gamma/tau
LAFVSLYRKYRSQTFADLVGQEHVVRTLQNAITSVRFSHAYLFTGPRGTGKTSTARLLAKALCCEHGPSAEPCNECDVCLSIASNSSLDVIEIDAASESGVEKVRDVIIERADYQPAQARFRVYIIDEVHDLSRQAFDALLKTIEEPPPHLIFILATTEFNKVPRTIQSRCQKYEFHRGSLADLVARLDYVAKEEGIESEPAALGTIARMADGGFRDALTLLEQASLTAEGPITVGHVYAQFGWVDESLSDEILLAVGEADVPRLLKALETVFGSGRDPRAVVESLIYRLAELTGAVFGVPEAAAQDAAIQAALHETAVRIGPDRLLRLRGELAEAHKTLREISLPRLWLESELLRLASQDLAKPPAKATEQPPARAVAAAPPKAAPPPAKPEPPAKPVVPPPEAKEEAAPTRPEPESTGNEEFDRAQTVWHKAVTELGALSKTMALKLASTVVAKFQQGELDVRFERQIERDAFLEGPKGEQRRQAVVEAVRRLAGEDWEVTFSVSPKSNGETAAPAVELPVEGERLVEMAKEILGGA